MIGPAGLYITLFSAVEAYAARKSAYTSHSLPQLVILALLVNGLFYAVYNVFIYPFFLSPLNKLPGPPRGNLLFGHARHKIDQPKGKTMRHWMETIPNDGLIHVKDFLNADAVLVTSPEMLKTVLSDRSYDYVKASGAQKVLRVMIGDGLVLVEGDVHKQQRRRILPSFNYGAIKDLYPLFWAKSTEMVRLMSHLPSLTPVKFDNWCTRTTLDIIGVAALGKDFNVLQNPDNDIVRQYEQASHPTGGMWLWFVLTFLFPAELIQSIPFWQTVKDVKRISGNLRAYALGVSKSRREELAAGVSLESKAESAQLRRPDVLSTLVRGGEFTDAELSEQVLTFMAAGHDTTSSALAWTACLMAKHKDIQARLREEIRQNLPSPDSDETINATQLDKMPLLNAVTNEVLRLYPTVPQTLRVADRETQLGEFTLKKGTWVWMSIWAINRSTKLWGPDAAEFVPDRWLTDGNFNNNGGAKSNYSLMTFLHGPRSCIGQQFARNELKCLVSALIGRFELDLAEDFSKYSPVGIVTSKPKNEALLNMKIVEGW